MPELPEVETLRRDLSRTIVGRTIAGVDLHVAKLFRGELGLGAEDLLGRRVEELRRRAKLLLWDLSGGATLVMHLKLTGQLVHQAADGEALAYGGHPVPKWGASLPHKASHVVFHFDDESLLYLTDIRQFARLWLLPSGAVPEFLEKQGLGPEPLTDDFTVRYFADRLARRGIPVKTVLLDQSVVGGIGNIYADESLWAAKINPNRPADSLSRPEVKRLHGAIRDVLDLALREGVANVPAGKAVTDRDFPYAHGRAGTACSRCGSEITKAWIGGRGSYWCPRCQKMKNTPARARATRG